MSTATSIPKNVKVDVDEIMDRIKKAMDHKGHVYARTMLGLVLRKEEECSTSGNKIIKKIKEVLGEKKFKVHTMFLILKSISRDLVSHCILHPPLGNYWNKINNNDNDNHGDNDNDDGNDDDNYNGDDDDNGNDNDNDDDKNNDNNNVNEDDDENDNGNDKDKDDDR